MPEKCASCVKPILDELERSSPRCLIMMLLAIVNVSYDGLRLMA